MAQSRIEFKTFLVKSPRYVVWFLRLFCAGLGAGLQLSFLGPFQLKMFYDSMISLISLTEIQQIKSLRLLRPWHTVSLGTTPKCYLNFKELWRFCCYLKKNILQTWIQKFYIHGMNFEMNLQLQLRLIDIPEHNYRMMILCSILLNCCSLKGKKKKDTPQQSAPFNLCAAGSPPPPPHYLQECRLCPVITMYLWFGCTVSCLSCHVCT